MMTHCGICLRDLARPGRRPLLACCQATTDQHRAIARVSVLADQAPARMTPARNVLHHIAVH